MITAEILNWTTGLKSITAARERKLSQDATTCTARKDCESVFRLKTEAKRSRPARPLTDDP